MNFGIHRGSTTVPRGYCRTTNYSKVIFLKERSKTKNKSSNCITKGKMKFIKVRIFGVSKDTAEGQPTE